MCGKCKENPEQCCKVKKQHCPEKPLNSQCESPRRLPTDQLLAHIYTDVDGNIFIECCDKTITLAEYTTFTGKQFPEKYVKMVREWHSTYKEPTEQEYLYAQEVLEEVNANLMAAAQKSECSKNVCPDKQICSKESVDASCKHGKN